LQQNLVLQIFSNGGTGPYLYQTGPLRVIQEEVEIFFKTKTNVSSARSAPWVPVRISVVDTDLGQKKVIRK
jgi:hypothetical protein